LPHGSQKSLRRTDKVNARNGRKIINPYVHRLNKFKP
jgi:hypothetical protein